MKKVTSYLMSVFVLSAFMLTSCAANEQKNHQGSNGNGVNAHGGESKAENPDGKVQKEEIKARPDMSKILPFESVINPCQAPQQKQAEADLQYLLSEAIHIFQSKDPLDLKRIPNGSIPIHMDQNEYGGVMAYQVATYPSRQGMPVVIASFGLGCVGNVMTVDSVDNLLLVLLEHGGSKAGQEVHLLQYQDGKWEAVWAPSYRSWEDLYMTRIELAPDKKSFTSFKTDIHDPNKQWKELWELRNRQYVKISSTE